MKLFSVVVDVVAGDPLWGSTRYKVKSCEWTFNETNEIHLSRHFEATAHKKDRAVTLKGPDPQTKPTCLLVSPPN